MSKSEKVTVQALLELCNGLNSFRTSAGEAYVQLPQGSSGRSVLRRIDCTDFQHWLTHECMKKHGLTPSRYVLEDAVRTFVARVVVEGSLREVYIRIAHEQGVGYIDLGEANKVVRVTESGWGVVDCPAIGFLRSNGYSALPNPEAGGSINDLRDFVNLPDEDDWVLFVGWMLCAYRFHGPHAVLAVQGQQGTGKSTLCRIARDLIDPNNVPLRSQPRNEQDLIITASKGWLLTLDNLTGLSKDLSNGLCRVSTGAGYASRTLYTNSDETLIKACRPMMLNGIGEFIEAPDLLDRSVVIRLGKVAKRQSDQQLWKAFANAKGKIFGALLNALAAATANAAAVHLETDTRMIDSVKWVQGAEPELGWPTGTFSKAVRKNQAESVRAVVDGDPVFQYLLGLQHWEGTPTELWQAVKATGAFSVPATANALGRRLEELTPALLAAGVLVERARQGGKGTRKILIRRVAEQTF